MRRAAPRSGPVRNKQAFGTHKSCLDNCYRNSGSNHGTHRGGPNRLLAMHSEIEFNGRRSSDRDSRVSRKGDISMEFQDKILKCVDCGADFVFTAGEQLFFHDKQFKNEPKRCKNCKSKRAQALGLPQGGGNYHRVETKAVCSACQRETTVPFKPTQGRPVYCRECFQQRRSTAASA